MNAFQHLVDDLWHASSPTTRCPHRAQGALGCVCHSPGCPEDARRLVVDHLSLQLWCLDAGRVERGHFYSNAGPGGRVSHPPVSCSFSCCSIQSRVSWMPSAVKECGKGAMFQ